MDKPTYEELEQLVEDYRYMDRVLRKQLTSAEEMCTQLEQACAALTQALQTLEGKYDVTDVT